MAPYRTSSRSDAAAGPMRFNWIGFLLFLGIFIDLVLLVAFWLFTIVAIVGFAFYALTG